MKFVKGWSCRMLGKTLHVHCSINVVGSASVADLSRCQNDSSVSSINHWDMLWDLSIALKLGLACAGMTAKQAIGILSGFMR